MAKKPTPEAIESVKRKCDFRWDILEVIIGGKSALDTQQGLSGFPMRTAEDADRFIRSYGFDRANPIEHAEVLGNFREALSFIRKHFLQPENSDGLKIEVPRAIVELSDIRDLFLFASQQHPSQLATARPDPVHGLLLREWACSILKVMHCVAHVDRDVRSSYFTDIQKQIFDRFYKYIHRDEQGRLFLGKNLEDPLRVPLVAFETKPKKSRESVLLKLLHKPESVADEIFDRVGIRFVTPTPFSALRVVKYLKDAMIVMPANIKPSRSRNTLIDIDQFRGKLESAMVMFESGEITEDTLIESLESSCKAPVSLSENPHSSQFYRAIQFTARQLIKLENPIYEDLKELKAATKNRALPFEVEELGKLIERIDLKYVQREVRFFYPYEVQVMDETSQKENERGLSAHSEYKRAQIQTAMKRVMQGLIALG